MDGQPETSEARDIDCARKATPMDLFIGSRVRLWRRTLAVDANALAKSVGITYQQLQKYEKGMNRISATRLYEIARRLNVPIDYFFEEANAPGNVQGDTGTVRKVLDLAGSASGPDLLNCCASIPDSKIRKALIKLMQTLAADADRDGDGADAPADGLMSDVPDPDAAGMIGSAAGRRYTSSPIR